MPVDDLEPPIDTVAPDTLPRDPELATYSDDELEALLEDEFTDYDRKLAAADELDQRAAGNRSQVWDEAAEDAREAWESAGGYAADSFATTVTGKPKGRRIDHVKTEWLDKLHTDYLEAEDATRGILIRKDRLAEFTAKYGNNVETTLFEGPARIAYYYASPELRDHWENIGGRLTFAEFAEQSGITDAKTRKRAAAARAAREDAKNIAEEDPLRRRKRQQDAAARRRRPKTAGEKLEAEQRRRDRIKAQERKLRAEGGYTEVDLPSPAPPAPRTVGDVDQLGEARDEVLTTWADLVDEFPDVPGVLQVRTQAANADGLPVSARAVALKTDDGYEIGGIEVTPRLGTPQAIRSFEKAVENGWFVSGGTNATHTVAHEFGHLLDYFTGMKLSIGRIRRKAHEAAGIPPGSDAELWLRRNSSTYARTERAEAIAEAFADVRLNGAAATPLSRAIYDDLIRRYKEATA